MKQSIKKIFTGIIFSIFVFFIGSLNVHASSTPVYWQISGAPIPTLNFSKCVFEDTSQVSHTITSYDMKYDLSPTNSPKTVYAYRVYENNRYTLYIQFNGTLYLNPDSSSLFEGFQSLTTIEGLQYVNTSNVTDMSSMFAGDSALTSLDLSTFDTSNVTNMESMFYLNSHVTTLNLGSSFTTSNVTDMSEMFSGMSSLTSLTAVSGFDTSNVTDMADMFKDVSGVSTLNIRYWSTNQVTDMSGMFEGMSSLTTLNFNSMRTPNVTNMERMFKGTHLQSLNLSNFNTSNVTDMSEMFAGMSSLTSLTITSFSTTNVTDMSGMFNGVSSIQTLDISSIRTASVTDMSYMFANMNALTQINLSNFNTASVTNMEYMFYNDTSLSSLTVTNFNTANVTNMSYMFTNLRISTIDVSSFNTASVVRMQYMFSGMINITELELGSFSTASLRYLEGMFADCTNLERIWVTYNWDLLSNATGTNVFRGDTKLAVDYGTSYDPNRVDKSYARIDTFNRQGYLNFHWSLTSSVYTVDFTNWKINAGLNLFNTSNLTPSANVTTSYDNTYYWIIYGGTQIRKFEVIRPILGISLDHANENLTLIRGRSITLTATPFPSNTTYDKTLTWESSNPNVATVSSNGTITGISAGNATITVRSVNVNNDSRSASTSFTVIVPISTFTAENYVEIIPNETRQVEYELTPDPDEITEDTTITWSSSDQSIVTIDSDGVLTGVTPGTTTITGVIQNGRYVDNNWDLHYGATVTTTVKVLIPIDNYRLAEGQHNPETHQTLYVGDPVDYQKQLTSIYTPAVGVFEVDGTLQWTSSDNDVATVSQSGLVTGVDNGTARITSTVKKYPQHTDYVFVDVRVLAQSLSFSNHAANVRKDLEIGNNALSNTFIYAPVINPSNSYYRTITYSSSNSTVASVNPTTGQVTALTPGTTTITATLANGKNTTITETRDIRVPVPITGFDVTESSVDLYVGHSTQYETTLTPVLNPSSGYEVDDSIEWTSTNQSAATVSNGVVTGVDNGTTTINARLTHYGQQYTDSTTVNVHVLTDSFTIDNQGNETLELEEGNEFIYDTTILPLNSAYKNIVWTTSDSNIASVANGVVTANSPGTVTITARLANGINPDIVIQKQVKVLIPIRQFSLQEQSVDLYVGDSTRYQTTLTPVYSPNPYEVDGTLEWTSSNDDVAEVTQAGVVTGKADGTVTISARVTHYGQQFIGTTTVHVHVLTDSVTITNPATTGLLEIEEGDHFTYETTILPQGSSYRTIVWSSSNDNIVEINPSTGYVLAKSPGTVTITGTLANGIRPDIVVTRQIKVLIPIRQFSLQEQSVDLYVGDSTYDHTTLTPVYSPDPYEVPGTLEWTSSNNDIAEVTQAGVVTGKADGTVTISARVTHYGQQLIGTTTVHVHVLTDSVTITNPATTGLLEIEEGDHFTYETTILPNPSSYRSIVWSSSNNNIVEINPSTGYVLAKSPGTVTITGTLANGIRPDIVVTRQIKVLIPIRQFSLQEQSVDLYVGDSTYDHTTLTPVYSPDPYEVPGTLEWTSSNNDIAEVTQTGVVTGKADGTVTISARVTHYGQQLIGTTTVHVHVLTDSVTITNPATTGLLEIEEGDHFTYETTILPQGSSYRTIVWSSSNDNIVEINPSTGYVLAKSPGTVTITGTLANGIRPDIVVTRQIKVLVPIRQFELTHGPYDLYVGETGTDTTTIVPIYTPSTYEVPGTLEWTSSNSNIAEVTQAGVVTGKADGTVTISARVVHYNQTFISSVQVNVHVLTDTVTITNPATTGTYEMEEGESFTYETTILPQGSSYRTIAWTSTDATIASVSSNGTVTANSPGTVTITGTLANGIRQDIVVTRTIHVKVPIRQFRLTAGPYNLYIGDSAINHTTITPILTPSSGYEVDDTIIWTSSNSNIVSVESDGTITAEGNGTATIYARLDHYAGTTYENTDAAYKDSVTVNVTTLTSSFVITDPPAQAAGEKYQMEIGETKTFAKTILPAESSYKNIVWTSSNSTIASVDDGVVTARASGDATITATLANGAHPDIVITRVIHVKMPITHFELTDGTYNLYIGDATLDHTTIVPIYTPSNFEVDGTLEWTTSNSNVATVVNGVVTAEGKGTATITARVTHYGQQFTDSVTVNVTRLTDSFVITDPPAQAAGEKYQMEIGEAKTVAKTITPQESDYKNIVWTTSNSNIARVEDGVITAVSAGDATITATLANGAHPDIVITRVIHVKTPITNFELTDGTYNLYVGDSNANHTTIVPIYTPSNFEVDGTLEWTTSNSNVATVSGGVVTGVGEGTATITARVTHYGQTFIDSVDVHVTVLASNLDISNQLANVEKQMEEGQTFTYTTTITPPESSYTTVTWTTSNSTIVSIVDNHDGTATITANSPGDVTITASLVNGIGQPLTSSRSVHVKTPIRAVNIIEDSATLYLQDQNSNTATLHTAFTPSSGYEVSNALTWTSSNQNVVTVDNGVITAVGKGTATITAAVTHYGQAIKDTASVEVKVLAETINISDPPAGEPYLSIEYGEEYNFQATVLPVNADYKNIVWSTSDQSIVSVDQNGKVTGGLEGDATITATVVNPVGSNAVTSRVVHVKTPIYQLDVNSTYTLYLGDENLSSDTITVYYDPPDYEVNDSLVWESEDEDVVTVDEHGTITAVSTGTGFIVVSLEDYPDVYEVIQVTVKQLAERINIANQPANQTLELEIGDTFTYQKTVLPANAEDKTVRWTSSNSRVVSVNRNTGEITAKAAGTVTITATVTNNPSSPVTETRTVKVLKPIQAFNIQENDVTLYVGNASVDHATLTPEFTPQDAEVRKNITWASDDNSIVTVNNGVVTAVGPAGDADITGTVTYYPQFSDTTHVHVKILASTITITNQEANETMELEVGQTFAYTTKITPPESSYTTVTWSSSDGNVVSVDSSTGTITAESPGTATITGTLVNGYGDPLTVSRTVKVLRPITGFGVNQSTATLYVGDSNANHTTLTTAFSSPVQNELPEVDMDITWTSSDPTKVAVVKHNDGTATITATAATLTDPLTPVTITATVTNYPQFSDTVSVTSYVLASNINITNQNENPKTMEVGETFVYQTSITPANSSYTNISWSSSNSTIVSINPNTKTITAVSAGTATITATLQNGLGPDLTVSKNVKVLRPITNFYVSESDETLYIGDATADNITLTPVFASSDPNELPEVNMGITWTSSSPSVATVDSSGHVVAGNIEGTTTITATVTNYPQFSDTITIRTKVLATSFSITKPTATPSPKILEVGQTFEFETEILPSNSSYTNISWQSSNPTIVSITPGQDGKATITAVTAGTVTITATLPNGNQPDRSVTRTVKVPRPITDFYVTESDETLYVGDANADNITLTPIFGSSDPSLPPEVDMGITWTSSSPTVATVDSSGHVVAGNIEGTTTITATVTNYPQFSDTITIRTKVLATDFSITKPTSTPSPKTMEVGDTYEFETSILPANSSYTTINWTSSNPTIVEIVGGANGKATATAKSAGTVTITATLPNGNQPDRTVTRTVKVLRPITGFDVDENSATLYVGDATRDNITLTPIFSPKAPDEPEVDMGITWTSSSPTVADVDEYGHVVAGLIEGTTTITATVTNYPSFHDSVTINTKVLTTDFNITSQTENTIKEMEVGDEHQYLYTILPANSSYQTVTWTSSNPTIVSVNANSGYIEALSPGTVTITATLQNGLGQTMSETRTVKVLRPITAFSITEYDETLYSGNANVDNITLTPVFASNDPSLPPEVNMDITWTSSDTTVARVDEYGHVVAQSKEGTATITGTVTNYPNFHDEVTINVYVLADSLSITNQLVSENPKIMEVGQTFIYETEILPQNSSFTTISWTTSNSNMVSITDNADGTATISADSPGTVTITASLTNGYGNPLTVSRTVKVLRPITAFSVTETDATLYSGNANVDNTTLTPVFASNDPSLPPEVNMDITWTSSDTTVARVDEYGHVVAQSKEGTATITGTVTNYPNFHDEVTINVYVLADSLSITNQLVSENPKIMEVGQTFAYETEILPQNSSFTTLSWITSNSNMVSITDNLDGTATISADSPGTVTITASLTNGYGDPLTVSRTVKVLRPITAFNVTETDATLYSGNANVDNTTLTPVFASNDPSLAPEVDMDITWTSSDNTVARVDEYGHVVAQPKAGTATITATVTNYPQFSDTVTVDVYVLAERLSITNQTENPKIMEEGQTFTYETSILPSNSSYTTLSWESTNSTIVAVTNNNDGTATITASSPGTATITARLVNGYGNDLTISKNVKVLRKITGFDVTQPNATLYVGDQSSDHTTLTTTFSSPIPNELPEVDMDITWTSSDPTKVNVTKHNDGTATITATAATLTNPLTPVTITATVTNYPQFSDTVDVTSYVLASSFEITNYQEGEEPMELEVGNSVTYRTRILPATSSYTNIVWATSDSTKVSIVDNGDGTATITGVAATGNTPVTITATLANGNQPSKVVTRTIKVPRPIQAFDVDQNNINLYIGDATEDHTTLTTTFSSPIPNELPEVDMDITWTSSDPTKVNVTKHNDGTATITATAATFTNPLTPVTITATVTNYPQFSDTVTVYSYVLTDSFELTNQPANNRIDVNKAFQYTYTIQPGNSSYQNIVWSSSVPTVANIDQNGLLTTYTPGDTVITARLANGLGPDFVETRNIHVNVPITFLDVTESSVDLYIGDSNNNHTTLTPVLTPSSGYEVDDTIIWTSSDDSVVDVDDNGTIRAVGNGTATIYARLDHYGTTYANTDPAYKDSVSVTVTTLTSDFDITNQLAGQTLKIDPGKEFQYEYELLPETSSYQNIIWTSSNQRIATISNTGKLTAHEPGTITITAHLDNGIAPAYNIERTVVVPIQMTGFSLTQDITDIYTNDPDELLEHATLTPVFAPTNTGVDRTLEWTSSNDNIATVEEIDGKGVVTGVNDGTATIYARVVHYGQQFIASANVTVHIMATDYDITNQESGDVLEIEVGEEFEYETEITPANSSYTTTHWSTSNSNIVDVDQDGVITGIAAGTATITTTLDNGLNTTISKSRTVKVLRPIDTFTITTPDTTLYYDDSNVNSVTLATAFTSTVPNELPEVDMSVTWTSSNQNVATVDEYGHVVAGSTAGTTTITGTVTNYPSKTDSITITTRILATNIDITTQQVSENPKELEVGEYFDYETTISPNNSSYTTVTWTSSNTSAVSIVDNGDGTARITADAPGTSTITATVTNPVGDPVTVTRNVKVLRPIDTFSITEQSVTIYYGNDQFDNATLHPVFTSTVPNELPEVSMNITWVSSNQNVVTVDNGVLTAQGKGTATITATVTNYPQFEVQVPVTVEALATSIDMGPQLVSENPMILEEGETYNYLTTISPNNSSYTTVTWTSSNPSAVSIVDNLNGTATISADAPGNSTITATVTNPVGDPVTVTRNVKVPIPIDSIAISPATQTLYIVDPVNDHATLTPVYNPSNAEVDKSVTWTSSNPSVVTVNNGVITAAGKGTATITATSVHYPQLTATANIEVKVLATGITIKNQNSNETMDLTQGESFTYETTISPNTSSFTNIVWSSSNTSAVSIVDNHDGTATITADNPGTTTITATIINDVGEPIVTTRQVRVPVPITAFNIVESTVNLTKNIEAEKTATIHTEFTPSTGYEESNEITWVSSNEDVATISNGVVTAEGKGTATITGTLANGLSDSFTVNVAIVIEDFILETPSNINVELGSTYEARTSYIPLDTSESTVVSWSSDNQAIAEVDQSGNILGKAIGNTVVRATLGSRTVTMDVHVVIGIINFELNETEVEMERNDSITLSTTIDPSNTTESKVVTWTASDQSKVTIVDNNDGTATITANAAGTTTITASLANGMHVECEITIITSISNFTLSQATASLETNDPNNNQVTLTYTIEPNDTQEDKTVTWSSSDSSVADVVDGVVTAEGNGTATITASLPNGMTATCVVTVTTPMESFNLLNENYKEISPGQSHTIQTSFTPDTTSDSKVITWATTNSSIASVVDGVVTANSYGTVTITGTLANNMSVEVTIKVIKPINSIVLSQNYLTLYVGGDNPHQATLTAIIDPQDAEENKNVTWSSDNSSVAQVDQQGNVTAHQKGTATISATLANGMHAECEVTVLKPITNFTINNANPVSLNKNQTVTLTTTITPSDTTDIKTVTWSSSRTSVATVNSSTGKVTAKAGGTATITARLQNGMTATITVNVVVPITNFNIGPQSIDMLPGSEKELIPKISPSDTTESKVITWSSSDSTTVSVVDGVLTAHKLGEATITASLPGGQTATTTVNVTLTPRTRMRGDIDDDGDVDLDDVVLGLRKIFEYEDIIEGDLDAGDIDYNGELDLDDIVSILRYIFEYDDYL